MRDRSIHKIAGKAVLLLVCLILMTAAFLAVLYHYDNKYTAKSDLTREGVCLIPEDGTRFLADGWEFYPDKLFSPRDFSGAAPAKAHYKTSLGEYPNLSFFHEDGDPYGVSTYRLMLRGKGTFSLYLQEPLCAVKVFIGGVQAGSRGNVTPEDYRPFIRDAVYSFTVADNTELVIQTANYSHYYGGLYYPPALGTADSISHMIAFRMAFYGLLCFFSLALALFSTVVWLGRKGRRDKAAFYFGLLALSFSVRICYPILRMIGVPLVSSLYALEDVAALFGVYCVIRISLLLFAPKLPDLLRTGILAVSMGMCGAGAVIPLLVLPAVPAFTMWYGLLISWYKVLTAAFLAGIALYGVARGCFHAKFSLAAITIYGVCLFSSVFFINQFEPICTGWQDEYGSFLLVLVFGGIMVRRNYAMAADNLHLTEHLQAEVDEKTQYLTLLVNERSQLMAELTHDMKSPVTSLSNMVQIIRQGDIMLDADAQRKIRLMEERCNALSDRIGSLQRLTAETGDLTEMHELSLNQFLTEFHRDSQPVVEMSGPDLICKLTQLPCTVLADPVKLRRALENLVFNAADFTSPDGNVHITLEREGSHAYIRVSDTGCGIPEDSISKVFDRFYTTRTDQGGQGLGLAITKSIILEHRGDITVKSEPGSGTVFTIRLPLLEDDAGTAQAPRY